MKRTGDKDTRYNKRRVRMASALGFPEIKMAAFLLWNVHGKNLDALVTPWSVATGFDVVLLVEYVLGGSQLPGLLLSNGLVRKTSSTRFACLSEGRIG